MGSTARRSRRRSRTACSRSGSRSPRSASRARSRSATASPRRSRAQPATSSTLRGFYAAAVQHDTFRIDARDGSARAGVLVCAHGEVETPAFVPLATSATVKGLDSAEVEALGFQMVLGNTFHLFLQPGHELIAELGGLHEFMAWRRPIITDSGGFQVFSMGHGSVADEIKGRRGERESRILSIDEEGVRFQSYADGSPQFMGPETSMEVQAPLGSDIALAFDEGT